MKRAGAEIPINVLNSRKKIGVINRKYVTDVQKYSKGHLDIQYTPRGTASNSNIEILQRYQNKVLGATVNTPWYISNKVLHADIKVLTIREEITKFSVKNREKKNNTTKRTCIHTT
jgi:hypothetical protein